MLSNTSCPSPCTEKKKAHHVTKKEYYFSTQKNNNNRNNSRFTYNIIRGEEKRIPYSPPPPSPTFLVV
jgi:hypothetical protein